MTTFDTLRVKVGRKPITVVEIDLDYCGRTYGTAPCVAAVGVTGTQKCFNTFKTCQDTGNFDKQVKTYKFCSESAFLPVGDTIFPCITDLDIAPTQLKPDGLAISATATISFKDFVHHDRGIDPYVAGRSVEPGGTFFSKLRARNPYMVNRVVRINTGYIDDDRTIYTKTRTYFIDKLEGPDAGGRVRLYCKDILRFTDVEKSKVPVPSLGSLAASITNVATSLDLVAAGVGATYPTSPADSRWLIIEDELVSYTGVTGDTLTGLSRGQNGTTAVAHDAGVAVQQVAVYNTKTVADVAYDLLTTYAGIPTSYINKTDWDDECTNWLPTYTISGVYLYQPDGVKSVLEKLLASCGAAIWWDDEAALIRFRVLVPAIANGIIPKLTENSSFLENSLKVRDLEKDRVSRVIVYHNAISKVSDDSKGNMNNVTITVDATTESDLAYTVQQSREIASRWIPGVSQARDLGDRILRRYKETPREFTFRLDAKDATILTGDLIDIDSRLHSNPDGTNNITRCVVTEKREVEAGSHYEYVALQVTQSSGSKAYLIAANTQADWLAASALEKDKYFFISDSMGLMSDLSPGAKII